MKQQALVSPQLVMLPKHRGPWRGVSRYSGGTPGWEAEASQERGRTRGTSWEKGPKSPLDPSAEAEPRPEKSGLLGGHSVMEAGPAVHQLWPTRWLCGRRGQPGAPHRVMKFLPYFSGTGIPCTTQSQGSSCVLSSASSGLTSEPGGGTLPWWVVQGGHALQ